MNELLILGLVLAVFAAACAIDWLVAEVLPRLISRIDCEITAYYAAKIVKRRVRDAFRRAGGEPNAGRNRL